MARKSVQWGGYTYRNLFPSRDSGRRSHCAPYLLFSQAAPLALIGHSAVLSRQMSSLNPQGAVALKAFEMMKIWVGSYDNACFICTFRDTVKKYTTAP